MLEKRTIEIYYEVAVEDSATAYKINNAMGTSHHVLRGKALAYGALLGYDIHKVEADIEKALRDGELRTFIV